MFELRIQLYLLEYLIAVEATNILATNRAEVHHPTTYIYLQTSLMIQVNYLQLLHSISILAHYCFDLLS